MIRHKLNPIIIREIRSRMRRRQTFFGFTGYVIGLGILVWGFYTIFYYSNTALSYNNLPASSAQYGSTIGKVIFSSITLLLLMIFPFNAVAFASDSIAGEKERQTYEILRITTMTTRHIVLGKLGAVFIFLVLYLLLALPIQALAFLFGGVTLGELLISTGGILVTGLAFAALGVYISSLVKTVRVATALSATLIIMGLYVLPFAIWLVFIIAPPLFNDVFYQPSLPLMLLLIYGGGFLLCLNPLSAAITTGIAASEGNGYFFFSITQSIQGGTITLWVVSPWLVYVLFYSLLTLLLIWLSTRRLMKMSEV